MASDNCVRCAKYLLIIFNIIFWLSGIALLAIGVWILLDPDVNNRLQQLTDINLPMDYIDIAAYIFVGVGVFILVVGFFGCCGAIMESPNLLVVYIVCMVIVMALEMAAGIYVAIRSEELNKDLAESFTNAVKNYGQPYGSNTIDSLQLKYSCCGANLYTDYYNSTWYRDVGQAANTPVPKSCCNPASAYTACVLEAATDVTEHQHLYPDGCYYKLINWYNDNSMIFTGVGIGLSIIQMLGVTFAVCLCRHRTSLYN